MLKAVGHVNDEIASAVIGFDATDQEDVDQSGFTIPPVMAILSAGRSAGAVGFIVGLLVGLGTGVLGSYTLKLTADYMLRSYERRKPGIVRGMSNQSSRRLGFRNPYPMDPRRAW